LKRLDFILAFVTDQDTTMITKYVEKLQVQYGELVEEDVVEKLGIDLDEMIDEFDSLKQNPELARLGLNYYLQTLQLTGDSNWLKEKVKVINENYLHSFLLARYYNLLALVNTTGREEAIKLYKRYITHYLIEQRKKRESSTDNLEELFESRRKTGEKPSEWVIIHALLNEGKYAYRNDNCTWVDALKAIPDTELKYLVCCYGDYEGVKMRNDNFILTMEHTIAEGQNYCSRIIHDTRVDYDLKHQPEEFWNDLKPDNE